jgi:transposase-like protein
MRQKWDKKVSRSKEERNDMEEKQEARKVRRIFTPEQKFEILKDIERCKTIKEGLAKHQLGQSLYHKWKRQLEVGVRASLRNSRPLKSTDLRRLEAENLKLKEVVLNQALVISELKKEMNLD